MKCPKCGQMLPDCARFCGACGTNLSEYAAKDTAKNGEPERMVRPAETRTPEAPKAPETSGFSDTVRTERRYDTYASDSREPYRNFSDRFDFLENADSGESYAVSEEKIYTYRDEKPEAAYSESKENIPESVQESPSDAAKGADPVKKKALDDVKQMAQQHLPKHLSKIGSADRASGSLDRFYIADFLMRLFGVKENIPLCIYLVMNILLIGFIMIGFTGGNVLVGMLSGLVLYILSMTLALSPFGEGILRSRTGFVPIEGTDAAERILPIFEEVRLNARKVNPNMPEDIKLYINDDESPNAFATGRRTVCMTSGMLNMSDEQIKGALGHEFGHLSHRDTDRILVIAIGNIFVTGFCVLMQISAFLMRGIMNILGIFMGEDGIILRIIGSLSTVLTVRSVTLFLWLWTGIGTLLCMKTSRGNEYQADEFSCRLGYGEGLISVLQALGDSPKPSGLFASLAASHPPMDDRITRIRHILYGEKALS